jgi:ADP-ribose pyrophosphatase YjhB (NUDIX family)
MIIKRYLANWLQRFPPLRWGLSLGVILFAPRNYVGVMGVIFNDAGQVLLAEHVFRPYYVWGLPGGWVKRGEDPTQAIQREIEEELKLRIHVKKLLLCETQGGNEEKGIPLGLGLAFYCQLAGNDAPLRYMDRAQTAYEILSVKWVDPEKIEWKLTPLQQKAIILGKQEFDRETMAHSHSA